MKSSYSNAYSYGTKPHAPTQVGEDLLTYDANGNLTYHKKADNTFLQYKWDEENRLMASDNFGLTAQYSYDASGMRVLKSSAENSKTIFINGAPAGYTYHEDNYTAYIGGHFEAKEGRYTKHYFNGAERLASKIGVGTLDNSEAKGYYQAGGIDYGKRYTDAYKDFKQIAKDNQLPPGPPNIKYIYAQEYMANLQNNEVVSDQTLLNSMSLEEWEQQNTDKDPGPPVCEPPFCDTGGNIDTGSLPENEVYFFHPDHLGSTSYITNISGETVQFNSYLPFGEDFVSQKRTTTISNYLFNGKEKDLETQNSYYGARYYNSELSIWLSVDPLALKGPDKSPYVFCFNNPINMVDPDGAWPWPIWARSFISASSVGGGTFRGDGRGPSLSTDRTVATSRTFVNFTFDPQKQKIDNPNVDADPTVFYGIEGVGGTSKKPEPRATFTGVSTEKNSLGNDIGSFGFSYWAKDPITPGFVTPNLDVHSIFSITENLKTGTLYVNATFTGDVFPSIEAFISDQSGTKLFLGARKETGGVGDLFGDNKKSLFTVDMQIKFDENGNFIGVQQGDKLINVTDWNKQVQSQFEKK